MNIKYKTKAQLIEEIHELKKQVHALSTSHSDAENNNRKHVENVLEKIGSLAKIGSWKLDFRTNSVEWSEDLRSMNQYDANYPVPSFMEMSQFYTPESWDRLHIAVKEAISKGEPYELDLEQIRKDGNIFHVTVRGIPDYDDTGKMTGLHGTVQDITERIIAEEAMRYSEDRLKDVIFSIGDWVWEVDEYGRYTYSSQKGSDYFGPVRENVIGKTPFDFMLPDDAKKIAKIFAEIAKNKAPIRNLENWNITSSGEKICLLTNGVPIIDNHGNLKGYRGVDKDITLQKQAESELISAIEESRENELRLKMAQEISKTGVWDWNIRDNTFYWSDEFKKVFRLPQSTTAGFESWRKALHPDDIEHASRRIEDAIANQTDLLNQYRILTPDNKVRWIESTGHSFYEDGKPVRMLGMCMDITERKLMEEELVKAKEKAEESENRFRSIVENTDMGYFFIDNDGIFQSVNKAWLNHYKYDSYDEVIGKHFTMVQQLDDIESAKVFVDGIRAKDPKYMVGNFTRKCKDGSLGYHTFSARPVIHNNVMVGIEGFIIDTTMQTELEQEMLIAKEKAEKSEMKYRSMFTAMQEGVYLHEIIFDKEGTAINYRIIDANPISEKYLNIKREVAVGKLATELFGTEKAPFIDIYSKVAETGNPVSFEQYFQPMDTYFSISVFSPKRGEFATLFQDITTRITFEQALKQSKDYSENLIQTANVMIIGLDIAGNVNVFNEAAERITGYCQSDLVGKNWFEVLVPKERFPNVWNEFMRITENGQVPREFENPILTKTGEERVISWQNSVLYEHDEICGTISFGNDITDKKMAEEALKTSERRYHDLFNQANEGLLIMTLDGQLADINPAFAEMHGYAIDELKGFDIRKLNVLGERTLLDHAEQIKRILAGEVVRFEVEHYHKDGHIIPLFVTTSLVNISGQEYFLAYHQDITQRKQAELDLIKAKVKAEESDKLKSAFLANMSHEIRTPMNGILGFSELLKEPGLSSETQSEYINVIQKSGLRMLNIISEIIDISKIESGQMEVYFQEININEKLNETYKILLFDAEHKEIELSVSNSLLNEDALTITDGNKLYSILTNLVKNAIKYTDQGSIVFGCVLKEDYFEFYVKDTGVGIPEDRQLAIFDRFIQADITDVQARQGAGLGLSISKAFVEMLGGKIWVESKEGVGSTFYFTIPRQTDLSEGFLKVNGSSPKVRITNFPVIPRLKILIAEDDETSEMFISILIKDFSKEILKAANGFEVVEICRKNPDIDLILMDINMPAMGGYEATQQIRQFNKQVVIIAQTAYGLFGDKERCLEAGCNDYISKPIKSVDLKSLIMKYFNKKS